jgi:phosphoribosylformimino-5-aminoimidazole carboxamide ribotide isomerase
MLIIPAIDLRAGKCVRLVEGRLDRETVYSDEPATVAKLWEKMGAKYLHIVDLDGAFTGTPKNLDVISEIINSVSIPVQIGGGIRDLDTVDKLLELGASRVILGTVAIINPELVEECCNKHGDRIVLGIDARNGKVAIEGWGLTAEKEAVELALEMKEKGIERIIFTDIWRDGTLKGPNLDAIRDITKSTNLKMIASGGISTIKDIRALKEMESLGVEGVIVGKALYAGTMDLQEALAIAREEKACIC